MHHSLTIVYYSGRYTRGDQREHTRRTVTSASASHLESLDYLAIVKLLMAHFALLKNRVTGRETV